MQVNQITFSVLGWLRSAGNRIIIGETPTRHKADASRSVLLLGVDRSNPEQLLRRCRSWPPVSHVRNHHVFPHNDPSFPPGPSHNAFGSHKWYTQPLEPLCTSSLQWHFLTVYCAVRLNWVASLERTIKVPTNSGIYVFRVLKSLQVLFRRQLCRIFRSLVGDRFHS